MAKIGVFKAQPVGNEFAAIYDWIITDKLTFCEVVEMWHNASDCPNIITGTPPSYGYL